MATTRLRKTVTQVTDVVFPASKVTHDKKMNPYEVIRGNEYVSSLPLQMAYYFNILYFPFWAFMILYSFQVKYPYLDILYQVILPAALVILILTDIGRLYVGFMGNLAEQVPELAGSWLLTIIISLPLNLFILLNEATLILPLERAGNIVNVCFVVVEIIAGYFAIKAMVDLQVTRFHQKQFFDISDLNEAGMPLDGDGDAPAQGRRNVTFRA